MHLAPSNGNGVPALERDHSFSGPPTSDGYVLRDAAPLGSFLQCGDCLSNCGRLRARNCFSWIG